MHYYQRHLGDYAKDTMHLSLLEHGVYTILLDWSYATERPLPPDPVAIYRICRATSAVEKRAVDSILDEFFKEAEGQRFNKRVRDELEFCAEVSQQKRLGAIRKHHPDWTDKQVEEHCISTAQAGQKRSSTSNTRARVHTPTANSHLGGAQVSDEEIMAWGKMWAGEMATGAPPVHPDWLAAMLAKLNGRKDWPRDWQRWLIAEWRKDFRTFKPKSGGSISAKPDAGTGEDKKNAALNGRTAPQARYEISQALEEVRRRLAEDYELQKADDPADVALQAELEQKLKALGD